MGENLSAQHIFYQAPRNIPWYARHCPESGWAHHGWKGYEGSLPWPFGSWLLAKLGLGGYLFSKAFLFFPMGFFFSQTLFTFFQRFFIFELCDWPEWTFDGSFWSLSHAFHHLHHQNFDSRIDGMGNGTPNVEGPMCWRKILDPQKWTTQSICSALCGEAALACPAWRLFSKVLIKLEDIIIDTL